MEGSRKIVAGVITYLAQCGVGLGTTGVSSIMVNTAVGKTKLGRAFAFVTSVCAGVCTAYGLKGMLRNGAEYSVNTIADAVDILKNSIEIRKEPDIYEVTKEDEAD